MRRTITKVLEHKIFQYSLYIKGIYGLLETIAGIVLIFLSSKNISSIVQAIFGQVLVRDPDDFIANLFMNAAKNLSLHLHQFISLFMIVHGLINIGIVLALLHKKLWVFPIVSSVLGLLIIYQTYHFVFNHSLTLLIITFVDIIIFGLLGFEYHRLKDIISRTKGH